MKASLLAVVVLVGAAAWGQLRITSFQSDGELAWTNFARVGAYKVEWAVSPVGPWTCFTAETNLNSIWVSTNRVTCRVPVSNTAAFYRVGWIPPDPVGVWDYRGYDNGGTLVVTGELTFSSISVLATNPPVNGVLGSWDLRYAGPPTNQYWYLGPQLGTGHFRGSLDVGYAHLYVSWPTNVYDDIIEVIGTIWPNCYTGRWYHYTWAGPYMGPFMAARRTLSTLDSSSVAHARTWE